MPLRLAIFDLDGTLKQERDPYVYLHRRLGTWEACQEFLARGLAGELSYDEWLRLDVALWRGVPRAAMEDLLRQNPYLPGARETVLALKAAGVRVALVSTGLDVHAELVRQELGLDYIVANRVLFCDGLATGEAENCVPEGGKGVLVKRIQAELRVAPEDCLAVGDSTSDADMFAHVYLGVAVNPASDRVRTAAGLVIETADLTDLLPRLRQVAGEWLPEDHHG